MKNLYSTYWADLPDDSFSDIKERISVLTADKHPILLSLPSEDESFYLSSGSIFREMYDKMEELRLEQNTPVEFYKRMERIFDVTVDSNDLDPLNYMQDDFNSEDGWRVFGWSDYYTPWKMDTGYKTNKGIQMDESAMIIGSTRSPFSDRFKFDYTKNGYTTNNSEYFDFGITESGKFFVVQNGQVQYMEALEFQDFLNKLN